MHDINFIRENPIEFDNLIKQRGENPCSEKILIIDQESFKYSQMYDGQHPMPWVILFTIFPLVLALRTFLNWMTSIPVLASICGDGALQYITTNLVVSEFSIRIA